MIDEIASPVESDDVSDAAIAELAPKVGVRNACDAVGVAQASYYRRHRPSPPPQRRAPIPHTDRAQPRALSGAKRAAILIEVHSERFARKPPEPPKLPSGSWINKPDDTEGPTQ